MSKLGIFGRSRSGKSVTAEKIAREIVGAGQIKRVVAHDPQQRFTDVATNYINNLEQLEPYVDFDDKGRKILTVTHTLFIFDESQMLFGSGRTPEHLLTLLALGAEYGCKFIFITHHPKLLPVRVAMYITDFFVFSTGSGSSTFDDERIESSKTLTQLMLAVKQYTRRYPRGEHGLGVYPVFPYAYLSVEKEEVKLINMPEVSVKKTPNGFKIEYEQYQEY